MSKIGAVAAGTGVIRYVLTGEVACKKNSNKFDGRTGNVYKTEHFRKWHSYAMLQVKAQGVPKIPLERYEARFVLYHATRRRIDSDNQVTSLLDLMQDALVVRDDCWTCVPHKEIDDVYRKGKGGAEIELIPITEDSA